MLAAADDRTAIFVWSLILIALLLAGLMLVTWLRRRMRVEDDPTTPGFTLADLRQMHRQGQLTDAEFERAKAQLVAGLKRQDKPPAPRE